MIGTKTAVLRWLIDAPDKEYEVKEYHKKRSLTANGYYQSLLDELKGVLGTSRDELHQQLLERYSEAATDEDGKHIVIGLRRDISPKSLPGHWLFYKDKGNTSYYIRLVGSSEMDSKQMSHLLDGLISECQEVGIPTLTSTQLARLRGYEPKGVST